MKTYINDLFDQLGPEEGNDLDEKIKLENNNLLYNLFRTLYELDRNKIVDKPYSEINDYIRSVDPKTYDSKTITQFSKIITDSNIENSLGDEIGDFINYLIQHSTDEEHHLLLNNLDSKINSIGMYNVKTILIDGDVGLNLGIDCLKGKITVNGNAGSCAGRYMIGGKIKINGNAGSKVGDRMNAGKIIIMNNLENEAGYDMRGGTIIVHGNAGKDVGSYMKKGTIIVNGDIKSVGPYFGGGDIFHKKEQIVRNGAVVS